MNKPVSNHTTHVYLLEDHKYISSNLLDIYLENLSDEDKKRYRQMQSKKRRQQFLIARALLSQVIFLHTGCNATIKSQKSGQPKVIQPNLFCSISHSKNLIAVGFSHKPIGLDIEQHKDRNFEQIASHFFHPQEAKEFDQLPDTQKSDWFYRHWTRKEAAGKMTGEGMSQAALTQTMRETEKAATLSHYQTSNYTLSCIHSTPANFFNVSALDSPPWIQLHTNNWH